MKPKTLSQTEDRKLRKPKNLKTINPQLDSVSHLSPLTLLPLRDGLRPVIFIKATHELLRSQG